MSPFPVEPGPAKSCPDLGESADVSRPPSFSARVIRQRLHKAAEALHQLHCQLEAGEKHDAESAILQTFNQLKAIDEELQQGASDASFEEGPRAPTLPISEEDDQSPTADRQCPRQDLNLHGILLPLGPQPSASANSATWAIETAAIETTAIETRASDSEAKESEPISEV